MSAVTVFRNNRPTMTTYRIQLVLLAWFLLPFTTTLAILCSLYRRTYNLLYRQPGKLKYHKRTILITGSSPPAAYFGRALSAKGHCVILADVTRLPFSSACFSTAFHSSHTLYKKIQWQRRQKTFVLGGINIQLDISLPALFKHVPLQSLEFAQALIALIQRERPDIWIPCPSLGHEFNELDIQQVVQALQGHAPCNILHADLDTTEMLTDEVAFTEYVEQLEIDIKAPDYRIVTSRDEVHKVLATSPDVLKWKLEADSDPVTSTPTKTLDFESFSKRRWTWPALPKDPTTSPRTDKGSEEHDTLPAPYSKVTLPLHSTNATYQCVAGMTISTEHPWIMREVVSGQLITAHLLVIHNQLRAFVASLPQKTHIGGAEEAEVIPATSSLYRPLASFAESFTTNLPEETSSVFSINFIVSGVATTVGTCNTIYATSCVVGTHPIALPLLMLSDESSAVVTEAITDMASSDDKDSYVDGSDVTWNSKALVSESYQTRSRPSTSLRGVYSFYPALLSLVILPLFRTLMGTVSLPSFFEDALSFCEKVLLWKEDLFDVMDPWPWWWDWHVRQPLVLVVEFFV